MYNGYTKMRRKPIRTMKKILTLFIFMMAMSLMGGCQRLVVTPTIDLSELTPQALTPADSIAPTATPKLDPATEQALRLYPLTLGSTWEYAYLGYDQDQEVVWRVVEKVVETRIEDGYYIAELERSAELLEGDPPPEFFYAPDTGKFWYLVDGENLYHFEEQLFTQVTGAWLDLVLPFPENGQAWYPHPGQRSNLDNRVGGYRYASAPFQRVLPIGGTSTCYNVATRYMDGTAEGTFCETIGFVYQEFNFFNRAFGYRSELRDFYIQ